MKMDTASADNSEAGCGAAGGICSGGAKAAESRSLWEKKNQNSGFSCGEGERESDFVDV